MSAQDSRIGLSCQQPSCSQDSRIGTPRRQPLETQDPSFGTPRRQLHGTQDLSFGNPHYQEKATFVSSPSPRVSYSASPLTSTPKNLGLQRSSEESAGLTSTPRLDLRSVIQEQQGILQRILENQESLQKNQSKFEERLGKLESVCAAFSVVSPSSSNSSGAQEQERKRSHAHCESCFSIDNYDNSHSLFLLIIGKGSQQSG